ncbi:MAG: DUF4286 family protein [Pirellulaceae bacterium]
MFVYTVQCEFASQDATEVSRQWITWLKNGHIEQVLAGGARAAEVVVWDGNPIQVEVQYRFPDRKSFEMYERDFAPALRREGLERFPPDQFKLSFVRKVGNVVQEFPTA